MSEESVVRWLVLLAAAALVACAAPKAVVVVDESEKPSDQGQVEQGPVVKPVVEPVVPRGLRNGIRLPANFTAMPDDTQFRSGAAEEPESSPGAVTARPPSDPVIPPDIGPKTE